MCPFPDLPHGENGEILAKRAARSGGGGNRPYVRSQRESGANCTATVPLLPHVGAETCHPEMFAPHGRNGEILPNRAALFTAWRGALFHRGVCAPICRTGAEPNKTAPFKTSPRFAIWGGGNSPSLMCSHARKTKISVLTLAKTEILFILTRYYRFSRKKFFQVVFYLIGLGFQNDKPSVAVNGHKDFPLVVGL